MLIIDSTLFQTRIITHQLLVLLDFLPKNYVLKVITPSSYLFVVSRTFSYYCVQL